MELKKMILIAVLAAAGWWAYQKMQQMATPEKIQTSTPVRYVNSLQQDVKRAQDVAQKANEKIKQNMSEYKKADEATGQ